MDRIASAAHSQVPVTEYRIDEDRVRGSLRCGISIQPVTAWGQIRTSSLDGARPLPPGADIGQGGQSVGHCVILLSCPFRSASFRSPRPARAATAKPFRLFLPREKNSKPDQNLAWELLFPGGRPRTAKERRERPGLLAWPQGAPRLPAAPGGDLAAGCRGFVVNWPTKTLQRMLPASDIAAGVPPKPATPARRNWPQGLRCYSPPAQWAPRPNKPKPGDKDLKPPVTHWLPRASCQGPRPCTGCRWACGAGRKARTRTDEGAILS